MFLEGVSFKHVSFEISLHIFHIPIGKETIKKAHFLINILVVVGAIGLETNFTLETNRKRVNEKLLKRT